MGVKLFTIIYQTHKNGDNEYKNHIQNILFFELNLFSTNRLEFNATKHAHTHHQTIGHSTNTITSTVNVKTGGKTRSPASARGPEPKQPSRTYPFPNTARTIFTTNRTSRRLSHQQTPLTTNRTVPNVPKRSMETPGRAVFVAHGEKKGTTSPSKRTVCRV